MAVGDAVMALSSVSNNSFLDIQPGASVEWFVKKVFHESDVEIYLYDGSNSMLIASPTGGNYESLDTPSNNLVRLRVKNVAGSTKLIGYSAFVTK